MLLIIKMSNMLANGETPLRLKFSSYFILCIEYVVIRIGVKHLTHAQKDMYDVCLVKGKYN